MREAIDDLQRQALEEKNLANLWRLGCVLDSMENYFTVEQAKVQQRIEKMFQERMKVYRATIH